MPKRSVNKPKVSLIIPCYKVENFLPSCLDSVLSQTLDNIEVIAINDGSPDHTLQVLRSYQKKFTGDKSLTIIDKKNAGVWYARLDGIKKARGEYLGFIDSDDIISRDYCEKLYQNAKKNNSDLVVCGYERIDQVTKQIISKEMCSPKYKTIHIKKDPGLLLEINTSPWNKLYRSKTIKALPALKTAPKNYEDMIMMQLMYLKSEKITFIKEPLYQYMVRSDSFINTINEKVIPSIYSAMLEVKKLYSTNRPAMLEYLDACAGLHLGISLMHYFYHHPNFKTIYKNNLSFLNHNFPLWQKNKCISSSYIKSHKGINNKTRIAISFYRLHLFKFFLFAYNFAMRHLSFAIKW